MVNMHAKSRYFMGTHKIIDPPRSHFFQRWTLNIKKDKNKSGFPPSDGRKKYIPMLWTKRYK